MGNEENVSDSHVMLVMQLLGNVGLLVDVDVVDLLERTINVLEIRS